MKPAAPELSVILLCPDRYETIRKTMAHLGKQTIRDRIEVVLVAPDPDALDADEEGLAGFHSCVRVASRLESVGHGYAEGIRNATAPVVALAEDHSFPQPEWAEVLLRAHANGFAAVGPAISNANPHSIVSRADLLIAYGPWLHPAPAGLQQHLPGHNSSYKRALLLQYGERLDDMMQAESVLHWDLVSRGFQLYLEPGAVTAHTNFELWSSWVSVTYHAGRAFAASRAENEGWSALRRVLFALASPLIPAVRFARILQQLLIPGRSVRGYLGTLPLVFAGLVLSAAGEAVGTVLGAGGSLDRMIEYEFHRDLHRRHAGARE